MDNVCCGDVDDMTCATYLVNAVMHCCGEGGSGSAACRDDVFHVYCSPGGSTYCECNETGDNCETKRIE